VPHAINQLNQGIGYGENSIDAPFTTIRNVGSRFPNEDATASSNLRGNIHNGWNIGVLAYHQEHDGSPNILWFSSSINRHHNA
jgi:hypothetical protein